MKPYYEQDGITIYHGDCLEIMPTLADAGVDLVIADPPYNVGVDYVDHDDDMPPEAYERWCAEWFLASRELCRTTIVFPGFSRGRLPMWERVQRWSAMGCWYKPGNFASGHLGGDEWEPWLYWGQRVGGTSVVRATVGKQGDAAGHPCPKPVKLIELLMVKFKAELVLDPFLGSGTTTKAAQLLGKRAIGIELSERYCEIAARRLEQGVFDLSL